jgi:acetyl esterase
MLDPQARALLDLMKERRVPPVETLTPADARRMYRERRFYTQQEAPEVGAVGDSDVPGPAGALPVRGYRPAGTASDALLPALVYFHGGGWTIGDRDTHDVLCRQLCNASGCAVFSVDYRLGPEHPFPAAVDDAIAAVRWIARSASQLRIDAARLAVGGDSAGGNLAAVVSLVMRMRATAAGSHSSCFSLRRPTCAARPGRTARTAPVTC